MIALGSKSFSLILFLLLCPLSILLAQDNKTRPPVFRVDVDTVFIKVSVSDPLNRYVTGLEKENFDGYYARKY